MISLIKVFLKIFFRNPRAWFFVIFLPAGLFAIAAFLSLHSIIQANLSVPYNDFLLIGILAMAVMQAGVYTVAYILIDYRKSQIFKRLSITPLSGSRFLVAFTFARYLIALLQTSVLVLVGILGFGVKITGFLAILVLVFIGTVIFLNLGYLIASIAKSYEEAAPYTTVVGLSLVFLGDVFFPIKNLPSGFAAAANFLPLKPLSASLRHFSLGLSSPLLAQDLLVLGAWLIVTTIFAQYVFTKKIYK